jgi:multidrug efflux system membrane fusion protein
MITANSAAPLVTISQIQPIKISFSLPQSDLQLILARQRSKGLIATVDTDDLTGKPLSAPVDFTSNAVNDKSGTVELRATFDNRQFSFLPGQLVNVTVELDSIPNAVVVPRDAVNDGPEGAYVYVVANGKTEQHDVKVLFDDSKYVAVEGDVKPGDRVIVEGQLRVQPDAAVNVLPSPAGARDALPPAEIPGGGLAP